MTLQGLHGSQSIIVPQNSTPLLREIDTIANESGAARRRAKLIRKNVASIQHKLNVVRYNAGLIQDLEERDYLRFINLHLYDEIASISSTTSFVDRCEFKITSDSEYRMFLTFFLESFAAAAFSLLDVAAHLLKEIYDLQFVDRQGSSINVTFANALKESKIIGNTNLHSFLLKYKPGTSNSVNWIKSLKEVRNRTTHRPITDVCRLPRSPSEGNLYDDLPTVNEFLLYDDIFDGTTSDEPLKSYVENCFDGLEQFVEELYDILFREIRASGTLPI